MTPKHPGTPFVDIVVRSTLSGDQKHIFKRVTLEQARAFVRDELLPIIALDPDRYGNTRILARTRGEFLAHHLELWPNDAGDDWR